jgi:zeaxanthin glucosyltransferase
MTKLQRAGRPLAFASLGHMHGRTRGWLYDAIAQAFDGLDFELIISTGGCVPAEQVKRPNPKVHVLDFVNQPLLLASCRVAVSHAGAGTLAELMESGVPFLATPFRTDQPLNARRAAAAGMALVLSSKELSAENIRAAVFKLVSEPNFCEQARRMSEELRALPGVVEAADVVERLAVQRQPILSNSV